MPHRTPSVPSGVRSGPNLQLEGRICLDARGKIFLGASTHIKGGAEGVVLRAEARAEIFIDEDCCIESQVLIHASTLIHIGRRCHIGSGTIIFDAKGPPSSHLSLMQPVIIEADVIIGSQVMIRPGVRIGWGSRIGSGLLITRDLPPLSNLSLQSAEEGFGGMESQIKKERGPLPEALIAHEAWFEMGSRFHNSRFEEQVAPHFPPLGLVD